MTVTIDLTPAEEARLTEAARRTGLAPAEAARKLVTEHLPPEPTVKREVSGTAAALLRGWLRDEATDDPAQIQKAQEELDEFKRNINANRAATGERLPYPE
jgi:hypothetical protein